MSSLVRREEFIGAARSRIGSPFRHHFKPHNPCDFGSYTADTCMLYGMDDRGYDCSGLVIASLCDVLDLDPADWPRSYRHVRQLEHLAEPLPPKPGDALVYHSTDPENPEDRHISIHVEEGLVIHSSGSRDIKRVVEGAMSGLKMTPDAMVIPLDVLEYVALG